MALVRVKPKAQITLPVRIRQKLGIQEGDYLEARVEGHKVVLIPQAVIAKLPPVTLSPAGERVLEEALEDVQAGRVRTHDSAEALIAELHDEADSD